jgi:HEAT repeat protein
LLLLLSITFCGCAKKQKSTAELLDDLKGTGARDRLIAVRLLPERKNDAKDVIPALIEAAKDKSVDIRLSAVIGLGAFGEQAKDAIPVLQANLKDPDRRVRDAAAVAIGRIDPTTAKKPTDSRQSGGR